MGRKTPVFIPLTSPGNGSLIELSEIPQEIKDEVEEIYTNLKANPNGRIRCEFDTPGEVTTYVTQVTSYCAQREAGPLRFRKSPTKNLAKTMVDFRITDATVAEASPEQPVQQDAAPQVPAKTTKGKGA